MLTKYTANSALGNHQLAKHLIDPILGISDPRTDNRIDFVGGIRGLEGLEKRVDSGEMAVAFSIFATKTDLVFAFLKIFFANFSTVNHSGV